MNKMNMNNGLSHPKYTVTYQTQILYEMDVFPIE